MKQRLICEAVEPQQCARNRDANPPIHPLGSPQMSKRILCPFPIMASSADAAFVEDADVDQELRVRASGPKKSNIPLYMPNKSGASSHRIGSDRDSDSEDARLLSPTQHNYGSGHDDDNDDGEEDWLGSVDFRGLPWWKRPSVCTCVALGSH